MVANTWGEVMLLKEFLPFVMFLSNEVGVFNVL